LVCLGNICRSPTAQVVLEQRLAEVGLQDRVIVRSGGTGGWHVGDPMDDRAAATLSEAGYDPTRHRARQYADSWADECDLVLAMDHQNLDDLGGRTDRVGMFRDVDPVERGGEVPDPYYGGSDGFAEVLAMVERTSDALVAELAVLLDPGSSA
jgi:protein-tyrosine phosphatase